MPNEDPSIEKAKERSQESQLSISSWQGVCSWYSKSYSFRASPFNWSFRDGEKKVETLSTRLRVLAYLTLEWMSYFRMSYVYFIFHRTLLHSINLLIWILPPLLQLNHQQQEQEQERLIDLFPFHPTGSMGESPADSYFHLPFLCLQTWTLLYCPNLKECVQLPWFRRNTTSAHNPLECLFSN